MIYLFHQVAFQTDEKKAVENVITDAADLQTVQAS